jgi:hypothetical protein
MSPSAGSAPHWLTYVTVFGTLFVALVAAAIAGFFAWRQWWTARDRLKFDLFEKRYPVYEATRDVLFIWSMRNNVSREDLGKFVNGIKGSRWLFSSKFEKSLKDEIFWPLERLRSLTDRESVSTNEAETIEFQNEQNKIYRHLDKQLNELDDRFSEWLQLKH